MINFEINKVEGNLGIKFNNTEFIEIAFTHSSYAKQFREVKHNERLEFLGDSVLQLTITEYLFNKFKCKSEGELTRIRSLIVCENSLHKIACKLQVGDLLMMSKGEESTGGRNRVSILADAIEAIIAAIYLDKGYDVAKNFILTNFEDIINKAVNNKIVLDFKTKLQEYLQKDGVVTIMYTLDKHEGPPHRRIFYVTLTVEGKVEGTGIGYTKKEAEQNAAKNALIKMEVIDE